MEGIMKGQCSCGEVQYEMSKKPLFVHACHCTNCQRQSGSAHALNAMIEADCVQVTSGQAEGVIMDTGSGMGQTIYRCPTCKIGLWSKYAAMGDGFSFVRVGSLNNPSAYPPDINIFAKSKQSWVTLLDGIPTVDEFYDPKEFWSDEALQRMQVVMSTDA
jgi:hypothetical protein